MQTESSEKFRQVFFKYKLHFILFWIIVYMAMVLRQAQNMFMPVVLISNFTFLSGTSVYACFVMFFLLPRYGYNNKIFRFLLYSLTGLLVMSVINASTDHWVYVNFGVHPVLSDFTYLLPAEALFTFLVTASFGSIKIADDFLNTKLKNEILNKESLSTELKFLKAQLHPHFLFNTLNNLYFLIKHDPEKASRMLLKLSDIMRYQLHESNYEKISLKKELENINNYIELEKIRKEDNLSLEINIPENIKDCKVSPYIFLPFVENAFKHLSNFENEKNLIRIDFTQQNGSLNFFVRNSKENNLKNGGHNGIGTVNLKRRMELLYPEKFNIDIKEDMNFYEVNLTLDTK